jgi:hypothetical protein
VRRVPVHPLLFATFPVLFLFAKNAERVRIGKIALPLAVVLVATVVVTAVAALVFRDLHRGAFVGSGLALLGLSYGHLWTAIQDDSITGVVVGRDMFLLPLWMVLGVAVLVFAWRVKSVREVTGICNAVATGLLLVSAVNTSTAIASQSGHAFQAHIGKRYEPIPAVHGRATHRDIFYLIFDRYGSVPVLKKYLAFDNTAFTDALRKRGFFVADRSVANYPKTGHALASSLNMDFLDDLAKGGGEKSEDWKPLYRTLVDPKVPRFLKSQGYRYAHIGSWYDPTASDPTAYVNYHYDKRSEFTRVLLQTTIVQPIAKRVGFLKELDGRQVAHNQILFELDSVLDASRLPGPTFTFAHILLPHEPFTFDAEGRYLDEDAQARRSYRELYIGQVRYANRRILRLMDELLDVPDSEKPIIVIQADEGPDKDLGDYGGSLRWTTAPGTALEEKLGILNAYYLPGPGDTGVYNSITPVNSFRKIFNHYFGTDLEILPDESYAYGNGKEPYRFSDITERLTRARAGD